MGRFASGAFLASLVFGCLLSTSCSSSNPTHVVNNQAPGSITLNPKPNVSLELGKTQVFIALAANGAGQPLSETFSFLSSNPSVVTVANNGLACAGTWDSLTAPTVCTPGATGIAQVTAEAEGVSSEPVTVYVHQHVTRVTISPVPGQPPTLSPLCFSKGAPAGPESTIFQASAFTGSNNGGEIDVTGEVGPFTWQTVNANLQTTGAVTLSGIPAGSPGCITGGQSACLNQQKATANSPGVSSVVASVDGVNSPPIQFTTCPVQSISISALDNPATSFVVGTGTSTILNATVTDILNMPLTSVPLTWSSNNQPSVKVTGASSTVFGSVGTVTPSGPGAGSVTASCTPPTCNGGITPSLPIYPQHAIEFSVVPGSGSSPPAPTAYVTSTGCGPSSNVTNQACITRVIPVTRSSSGATFTPGAPINLPFSPNSLLFDPPGAHAYLGVDSLSLGTQSSMVLSGSTVTSAGNAAGRVLATSPDGSVAIFSDTADTPNRVFICQNCGSTSASVATFLLDGATAAAFSPDQITGGFKAYIVAGQSCPGTASAGCLLVSSKVDAAKIIPLGAPATDVTFIGDGILGYIATPAGSGATFLPTCNDPLTNGPSGISPAVSGQFIRALPDGQSAIALNAPIASIPTLQTVSADVTNPFAPNPPPANVPGCPAPRGFLDVKNFVAPPISLSTGSFSPTQFFLSPDASTAYILGQSASGAPPARLPFIIVANLSTGAVSDISLSGNAVPLSASISPAGDLLFVGADDGTLHIIDTATLLDIQQVTFPFSQSSLCVGPGNPATAVETTMTITDAAQTGAATTFSYTSVSGPALQFGEAMIVTGMTDPHDNGTFAISALSGSTFTVTNATGVTLSGQNGTGTSGVICNPDLVAVKP